MFKSEDKITQHGRNLCINWLIDTYEDFYKKIY